MGYVIKNVVMGITREHLRLPSISTVVAWSLLLRLSQLSKKVCGVVEQTSFPDSDLKSTGYNLGYHFAGFLCFSVCLNMFRHILSLLTTPWRWKRHRHLSLMGTI